MKCLPLAGDSSAQDPSLNTSTAPANEEECFRQDVIGHGKETHSKGSKLR